jgi:predicted nucleic acid-binding protein
MNVSIDTNVVLDVLLGREPFAEQSAKVVFLSEKAVIDGYVPASAVKCHVRYISISIPSIVTDLTSSVSKGSEENGA